MEKVVNAVLIILLALVAILIIFLFIELEKLDISFEDDFDIPINLTIPQEKSPEQSKQPKINNTKPVLIKPNEISNLEQTNNGTIRWSKTITIPPNATYGGDAHCSFDEIATGGGTTVVSGDLKVLSEQLNGPKNSTMHIQKITSWKTTVENQGNLSGVFKVFVICEPKENP